MFCAIWIKPINLTSACKLLHVIVSKWPLDQLAPLGVTDPTAEEIISSVLRLLDVKHRKKGKTTVLKCATVSQIKVISSLDDHRPFREPGILE